MSNRFPLLPPGSMDQNQRSLYEQITAPPRANGPFRIMYDDGALAGPFNALLHSPAIGNAVQALGAALRFGGTIPDRTREIVICAVAVALDAEYEWYAHSRAALTVGVSAAELDQLRAGDLPENASDYESAALLLTSALLRETSIPDAVHAQTLEHLGHQGIVELTVLVGYYRTLAGLLAVAEAPIPVDPVLQ